MRAAPRPVILASVRGRTVALRAISNGSGYGPAEVARLVASAAVEPRKGGKAVFVTLSELTDVEAMAEFSGVIVQRLGPKS